MRNRIFLAVLVCLTLAGCSNWFQDEAKSVTPAASLAGYWQSSWGDGFEITGTHFAQYDDGAKSVSFAGTIVNAPDLTAPNGVVVIQVTDAGTWTKTVGKYYVARWKSLAGNKVTESTPYKNKDAYPSANNTGMDTADAALAEYTEANLYFGIFGDYLRQ